MSIFVFVHFIDHCINFFEADKVSSAFYHSLHLSWTDWSISIQVERVECIITVVSWSVCKSLSHSFSGIFNSEMSSPHILKFKGSCWQEAVISSDWSWGIVRWSSLYHACIVRIFSKESILKLSHAKSSISISVVSGDEKLNIFVCWENIDSI